MEKTFQGTVISNKAQKTVTVRVYTKVKHARYQKYMTKISKYLAHDEKGIASEGDVVEIVGCRPLSKSKKWRLTKIVTKNPNIK